MEEKHTKDSRIAIAVKLILVLAVVFGTACIKDDPEAKARYVKAPLLSLMKHDTKTLNEAYQEAKTRLASVRDDSLRQDLARDVELEYQRRLSDIRQAAEKEAAREREAELARQAQIQAELKRQREAQQEEIIRQYALERRKLVRQCVANLEANMRWSDWIEGTKVLQLRNACNVEVDFDLRCFTRDGRPHKTIFMLIPPRNEKDVGFSEGVTGNFLGGERCEALFEKEVLWEKRINKW